MASLDKYALLTRHHLLAAIRQFFEERGYLSVDTPIAVATPGTEVHLEYFPTEWRDYSGQKYELFLRSSPELHMKRLICNGIDKVYQLAKCFRNSGELTSWHHPEFTMLEWYEAGISYFDFMRETEDLLRYTLDYLKEKSALSFQLPERIERISVYEAFSEFAKITLIDNDPDLAQKALHLGYQSVQPSDDFETAFFKIQLDIVEPALKKRSAVFLFDYPPSQAALARVHEGRAKRFELYLHGVELCNAFWELLDPQENLRRFRDAQQRRDELGKTRILEDHSFFSDLSRGMPDCCGNALGVDRWLALVLGDSKIDRAIPFRSDYPFSRRI
jgi:lysyl-tRNA synthetase class 2